MGGNLLLPQRTACQAGPPRRSHPACWAPVWQHHHLKLALTSLPASDLQNSQAAHTAAFIWCFLAAGAMFQLIGGTAAAVLIFGIPGALLLKSSYDQHTVAAANSPGHSLQQGVGTPGAGSTSLQEPLLQPECQPDSAAQQQQQAWRWWGCRKFWAGAALEVVTVASWGVTLYNLLVLQGP